MTFSAFREMEPFGEPSVLGTSGRSIEMFRFGYRTPGTEVVLAAVEVPLFVVQQSIPQELSVRLSQNSTIIASLSFDGLGECNGTKEVPLVQLVEELIEPQHLSMDEIKASDLEALLQGLESSIQLVRTAISGLKSIEELSTRVEV